MKSFAYDLLFKCYKTIARYSVLNNIWFDILFWGLYASK